MFNATNTQAALGITADGIAGPATFSALLLRASERPAARIPARADLAAVLPTKLDMHQINTPLRVRHFLAQAACETFGFTRLVESDGGDPNYFQRYEHNPSLGNTVAGDGARFKGRGLLDTTGRYNYGVLAHVTGLDLLNHPELLEDPANAVEAACVYWAQKQVNAAADANDIRRVTLLINGGYNGLSDRQIYFDRLGVIRA